MTPDLAAEVHQPAVEHMRLHVWNNNKTFHIHVPLDLEGYIAYTTFIRSTEPRLPLPSAMFLQSFQISTRLLVDPALAMRSIAGSPIRRQCIISCTTCPLSGIGGCSRLIMAPRWIHNLWRDTHPLNLHAAGKAFHSLQRYAGCHTMEACAISSRIRRNLRCET